MKLFLTIFLVLFSLPAAFFLVIFTIKAIKSLMTKGYSLCSNCERMNHPDATECWYCGVVFSGELDLSQIKTDAQLNTN